MRSSPSALLHVSSFLVVVGCSAAPAPVDVGEAPDAPLDAAITVDAPLDTAIADAGPIDAPPACELGASNGALSGTTPSGPIDFRYAWAGRGNSSKACFGVAIYFTEEPSFSTTPSRHAYLWLPLPTVEPIEGEHMGVTLYVVDGATTMTTDQATVDVLFYTRDEVSNALEATITAAGDGWNVSGTLIAPHCVVFADPCI